MCNMHISTKNSGLLVNLHLPLLPTSTIPPHKFTHFFVNILLFYKNFFRKL